MIYYMYMNDEHKTSEAIEAFSKRSLGEVKVLMIEDDPFLTDLVATKLSAQGCVPYSCKTGEEAIALAETYSPNVIILDLMLPGVSGEDVLKQLKAHAELKNIPVLVFSNKSLEEEIQNCFDLGAAEFLIKSSTDLNNLVEIVQRLAKS